jgi:HSP20 family protein
MTSNSQTPMRSSRMRSSLFPTPFDRFFRNDFLDLWNENLPDTIPSINITENKDNYLVEVAAPGLKKEDFNIQMNGNLLVISSEKEAETKEGGQGDNYRRREYNYSSFSRSLTLPDHVDSTRINARYNDGILNVTIPKKSGSDQQQAKRIQVE